MNPKLGNTINWIFFDLGGVLLDTLTYAAWRIKTITSIARQFRPDLSEQDILGAFPQAGAMKGSFDDNFFKILLRDQQHISAAVQEIASRRKREIDYYESTPVRRNAQSVLLRLSERYRLGIMANQPLRTKIKLGQAGIAEYFSHLGVSDDYKLYKPDKRFFLEILKETGADPRRSAIVDDNIERGLLPAKALGMVTVWYQSTEGRIQAGVDFVIQDLNELPGIFLQ